jgi:hypothetical protein
MFDKDTILGAVGIAAVVGGIWWFSREPTREATTPTRTVTEVVKEFKAKQAATMPPGWYALLGCSPFTSADGKTELSFRRDYTLKRGDVNGTWTYEPASDRYVVNVDGASQPYTLFDHDGVQVCLLVPGDITSANLETSWFSNSRTDESDKYDRDD